MPRDVETDQVVVVIPKRDELRAAAAVFGFDAAVPDLKLDNKYDAWRVALGDTRVCVVSADSQGGSHVALATSAALSATEASVAVCLGTAAGRVDRTAYLDVVLATTVLDAHEWRAVPGGLQPSWTHAPVPVQEVLHDLDDFAKRSDWKESSRAYFRSAITALGTDLPDSTVDEWPGVTDGWIATTSFLVQDADLLNQIWSLHTRLRGVDMESADFVNACIDGPRRRAWIVIRAVSDFGTRESKRDELRPAAAAAAASICRAFIERGLNESHPLRLSPDESPLSSISNENFYASLLMPDYVSARMGARFGFMVPPASLMSDITFEDVKAIYRAAGPAEEVNAELAAIRQSYFTEKYLDYDDGADLRGHLGPSWVDDISESLNFIGLQPFDADVIYVGIGTGRDVSLILPNYKSLVGVDLSAEMLKRAEVRIDNLTTVCNSAESLRTIPDLSVDLYLSLRTFQSSLFDMPSAVRQAHRVLRSGGGFLVSLPSGYVDVASDGTIQVVPGLLVPGTTYVDRARPRRIADAILQELEHLMFERIGFHQRETDLYIYGRKAV